VVPAFALLPAGAFPATLVLFGAELGFLDLVFFADFVDDLFGAFFAAGVFFAVFLAFFTARVRFFARFFSAEALTIRVRDDLRAFFAVRFLTIFFLAVATTISFIGQKKIVSDNHGGAFTA
jgi:hypothetical protein